MSSPRRSGASRIRAGRATSVPKRDRLLVGRFRRALLRLLHRGVDLLLHLLHGPLTLLQLLLLDRRRGGGSGGGFDTAAGKGGGDDDDEKCFHACDSTPTRGVRA